MLQHIAYAIRPDVDADELQVHIVAELGKLAVMLMLVDPVKHPPPVKISPAPHASEC
jgi:hypothetical protein